MTTAVLDVFLKTLMSRYAERVPDVKTILNAMIADGLVESIDGIENDHIAFRTMGVPQLGIRSLEKIFLHHGYERKDAYHFEQKKLDAYWYAPPADKYPRIFISELRFDDLSSESQRIIKSYTDQVTTDPVDEIDLNDGEAVGEFLHRSLWSTPTWEDYQALLKESEYASWVIYNRYYLNHFTISIQNLPEAYADIGKFNQYLESLGIVLNDSGGKIKVSADGKLLQSSTVAGMILAEFPRSSGEGTVQQEIAGSYVEFAERKVLDEFIDLPTGEIKRKHRREGFETANADSIFESTYSSQTLKS